MSANRRVAALTRVRRRRSVALILAGSIPPTGIVAVITVSVLPTEHYLIALAVISACAVLLPAGLLVVAFRADRDMNQRYEQAAEQVSADVHAWGVPLVGDMPGWKVAEVTGPFPQLTGLTGASYAPVDTMECLAGLGHASPQLDCTCGFHAFWNIEHAHRAWRAHKGTALLLVEGYGTVVEHEDGWRSQRQEVLQVILPPRCTWCRASTEGLASAPNAETWHVSCQRCGSRWNRFFLDMPALRSAWRTEVRVHDGPRLPRAGQWWQALGAPGL